MNVDVFVSWMCLISATTIKTEVQFNGDSYVELSRDLLPHTVPEEPEQIHIEFSTTSPNGMILWHGQTPNTSGAGLDYLSLAGNCVTTNSNIFILFTVEQIFNPPLL